MMADGVSLFCLAVETGREFIKVVVRSAMVPKAAKISVPLWRQATGSPKAKLQLEAYDDVGNLLIKSPVAEVEFLPSVNGVNHVSDTSNPSIVADIAANTSARHTHENADVLGKFGENNGVPTYDGKPVGGGERATAEVSFTEEWGDFFILTDTTNKKVSITVKSDSLTTETEIKSIMVLFDGQEDYIDLRDLTLSIDEDCDPIIVSYHHPSIDKTEPEFAGLRVAALYFPTAGAVYQMFFSNLYLAVKIVYYTEG